MSEFSKGFWSIVGGITATVVSTPFAVIAATVNAIDKETSLKDAINDCGRMIGKAGDAGAEFCEENEHHLTTAVSHVAKHIIGKRQHKKF